MKITDSLEIGKPITAALEGIADVYALLPSVNATYPCIVYQRINLTELSDKDFSYGENTATVELTIATPDYARSIALAVEVRKTMGRLHEYDCGLDISRPVLVSALESVQPDGPTPVYLQILTYQIEIE